MPSTTPPEWAEFVRTEGISSMADVEDPRALRILDRSDVFREFVSLMESIGMAVDVRSEWFGVNQAGKLGPLAGIGLPEDSVVPWRASVSFVLRGNGDGGG